MLMFLPLGDHVVLLVLLIVLAATAYLQNIGRIIIPIQVKENFIRYGALLGHVSFAILVDLILSGRV